MAELFHVGLTVKNLEQSVSFYRDVLGMEEGKLLELKSPAYRDYVQNPEAHIKFTYLSSGMFTLQLIEYVGGGAQALDLQHNRAGCPHLAFYVPDADAKYRQIRRRDPDLLISGIVQLSPRSRNFYARDPDGVLIEFCQLLEPEA